MIELKDKKFLYTCLKQESVLTEGHQHVLYNTVVSSDITKRVKTLQDALFIVNPSEEVLNYLAIKFVDPVLRQAQKFVELSIIVAALNEGWTPNWDNSNEYKYWPWFYMRSGGFSFGYVGDLYSFSDAPSRLCFKTENLAKYAAITFVQEYSEFFLIQE